MATGIFAAACPALSHALADVLYHDGDADVRWDNTLTYTAGFRVTPRDSYISPSYANFDDGNRNFAAGLMMDKLDLVSQFEASVGDFGLRVSAEGWYDTVYFGRNANDSPGTFNPFSVPHDEFTKATRDFDGDDVLLDDAFVHYGFTAAGVPVTLRVGRFAQVWGESLFFGESAIAAGEAPLNVEQVLEEPAAYTKRSFLPAWQAALTLQPLPNVSIAAYDQIRWRGDLEPGSGSYFSYDDYLGPGGERFILWPETYDALKQYFYRTSDIDGHDAGQLGVSLTVDGDDVSYGLYALRYNAKEPELYIRPGAPSLGAGTYQLVFPDGIELYGASLSTYVGDSDVSGEISVRRNMPLLSEVFLAPGEAAEGNVHPRYAIGDVLDAQLSASRTFGSGIFWQRADAAIGVDANQTLSITANPGALVYGSTNFAAAVRATFEPAYFEVLPALDISLPLGIGLGLTGNSSFDPYERSGGGDVEAGISATYRSVWHTNLTLTHYIGGDAQQPLAGRDFVLLSLERTI